MASVVEVTDVNHSGSLLLELNEQRLKGMFCDITVIVEDTKFKAHKNVLAASSPYFKEVLSGNASWHRDQMFELPDIQAEVFSNILNFIYNSRLTIQNLAVAREIASVGRRLGISCLENLGEATEECRRTDLWPTEESSQQPLADISQNSQGTKETSFCDSVDRRWGNTSGATLNSTWTSETTMTSRSLLGGSISPVDLTSPSSRRSAEPGSPPMAPCFQNPSIQLESIQSIPSAALPIQGQGKLPLVNHMDNGPIPAAPNKDCEAQGLPMDTEAATAETAKILYALSTVPVNDSLSSSSIASEVELDQDAQLRNRDWDHISLENAALEVDGSELSMNDPSSVVASSDYSSSTFHCRLCNRSFSSSTALSLHVKLHRPRRTLACRYCCKSFIHVKRLQTHEVLCKQTERIPIRNEGSVGLREQDFGEEACSSELLCHPSTGKQISSKKDHLGLLFRHRSFQRLDLIPEQDHFVKVVDGHLIYFCTVCERSYMTLSSLKRHSNVHSWRRKYPCRYCDKIFALAEYRTKHEVWHTGERRYQCIFCWETFVTYYNLKTHQKAFHGINPGLISSEKTPNGGYKPKMNALKLYRLLPMRSQKRPYKTYSQSLSENLVMPSQSLPVPLGNSDSQDGNLEAMLTGNDASSLLFSDKPASLQTDPSSSRQEGLQGVVCPPEATGNPPREFEIETALQGLCETSSNKHTLSLQEEKSPKLPSKVSDGGPSSSSGDSGVPSVIAYGHPSSSVIRSTTLPSAVAANSVMPSVITYNSTSTSQSPGCAPLPQSQPSFLCSRQSKKHNLKDGVPPLPQSPAKLMASTDQSTEDSGSDEEEEEIEEQDQEHRFRYARSKTMTYMAKPAYVGAASESRSAPLCQITVRIGEEAIVKRRISETDLMRDKSPCGKVKRFTFGSDHAEHRIRKTEKHSKDSKRKTSRSLGQDTCDEDSERDTEDHLWRPYYTYKPKRKACSVQKVKKSHWRRKLRYKRSLHWIKRAEKEENRRDLCSMERSTHQHKSKDDANSQNESCPELATQKQNHDTAEWKYECTTCGKQFVTLKRLQKHEKAHNKDRSKSACERCPEESNTSSMLGHKAKEDNGSELNTSADVELLSSFKSTVHRVGRKPLVKHICVRCSKVCKTAAALGRHMKRHGTEEASHMDDAPIKDGESQDLSPGPVAAPTTVITYSKKSEEESAMKEATTLEELDCEGSLPPSRTIKEENPQEMKVSSSSEDQPVAMETEVERQHLYSSPATSIVHSANSLDDPLYRGIIPVPLEAHNTTPPVTIILKVNNSEDPEPLMSYTNRSSPTDHLTDQMLVHSQTPPLQRRSEPQEPHTNQDPKMQQEVMSHTSKEIFVEAISEPLTNRASNCSPRLQREVKMPCVDEGAPLSEAKMRYMNHPAAAVLERVTQQSTEAQMGIPICKARAPPLEDLSLQDPVISHTGGGAGLNLVQKCPPSKMAEDFQSTLQHELCAEPRFPLQEYPLPLLAPGAWATRKEMEEKSLLSYPSALQFGSMGKVPNSNPGKVTFYPDPYPLMYGHQLLAYPYNFSNLTALPVALNMVIPDEKGQPLPFLPSMFGYALNPCRGELQESAAVGLNGGPSHGKGETAEQERLKRAA
uniref:Zinc finger and BTB domain-containing protein 4 n=1 Tax=Geotrypetes seraphini TaxID=260995 RepID=A0A6P8Q2H8_GEOSA|nr:zinc finger and BTB domain-containing protein 4 [Geotrypetes seraphini]XP_033781292.1 zinc finger and BTB domain-containing protein 4 [Geotrypetes seraphini]XP_033781293.1 zinc finger and BTB domain-containing protein 4 [Geotrypetes seraphini]XP_033781294.1 zinc finger and BTB domain-containing protein 4 [Geotrypetes seraphini]XP_033781295.1 zinc finger and BTB domain-containing protein 4 [Geotrypetes seraphini]XP_033781296.1 zinc finger and BTB domain-containing protein 4 [Geotrypetes sera